MHMHMHAHMHMHMIMHAHMHMHIFSHFAQFSAAAHPILKFFSAELWQSLWINKVYQALPCLTLMASKTIVIHCSQPNQAMMT